MKITSFTIMDLGALIVSLILVVTLSALLILGKSVDPVLTGAFGTMMGWIFRAGAAANSNNGLTPPQITALTTLAQVMANPPTVVSQAPTPASKVGP